MPPGFTTAWNGKLNNLRRTVGGRWRAWSQYVSRQAGQTLAELAIILSVLAVVVVVTALTVFRDNIAGAFSGATSCVQAACSESANDHCTDGHGQDANQPGCNR